MRKSLPEEHVHTILTAVVRSSANGAGQGLSLRDVVRLGACSHASKGCLEALLHDPVYWIRAAMSSETPAAVAAVAGQLRGMGWTPSSQQLEDIARTPISRQDDAEGLVTAGVCPTYAQLRTAAAEGVQGVRLWAAACHDAGLPFLVEGMPAAVAVVCCGSPLQAWHPEAMAAALLPRRLQCLHRRPVLVADIFLFALDCKHMLGELHQLARALTAHQLQQVLPAAIKRQRGRAVWDLYSQPLVRQLTTQQLTDLVWLSCVHMPTDALPSRVLREGSLDAGAVADLVGRATQQWQTWKAQGVQKGRAEVLHQLLALPAAASLPPEQLAAAMVAGRQAGDEDAICTLAAAAALTGDQLLPLLRAAVQLGWLRQTQYLLQQPGAQQLAAEHILELVQLDADAAGCGMECLLRLPAAAAALTGAQLLPVLTSLVQRGDPWPVEQLCQLPVVQQLTADQVLHLLHLATGGPEANIWPILELPAAAALSGPQLALVLTPLVQQGKLTPVKHICQRPAAQQLTADQVLGLLQLVPAPAPGQQGHDMLAVLHLPAAAALTVQQLQPLLDKVWDDATAIELCLRCIASNCGAAREAGAQRLVGLANAFRSKPSCPVERLPGLVPSLVAMLSSSSLEVVRVAAQVLRCCMRASSAYKERIGGQPGLLDQLVGLLGKTGSSSSVTSSSSSSGGGVDRQQIAAQTLSSLLLNCAANQQRVADTPGALQALVALLGSSKQEVVQQAAAALVSATTGSPPCAQQVLGTPAALTHLTAALKEASNNTQWSAAACIGNIVLQVPAEQQEQIAAEPGLLEGLGRLLGSVMGRGGIRSGQKTAARAYGTLACSLAAKRQVTADTPGLMDGMVCLLDSLDAKVQQQAVTVLAKLVKGSAPSAQRLVDTPRALTRLAALLTGSSCSESTKRLAAVCISSVAQQLPGQRQHIAAQEGVLIALTLLLKCRSSKKLRASAATALGSLARDCVVNQQLIAATPGAVQAMVALMGSMADSIGTPDYDLWYDVGMALLNITLDPSAEPKQNTFAPLTSLLALLQRRDDPGLQRSVAEAISFLTEHNSKLAERIAAKPGVVEGLLSLLHSSSPELQAAATEAVRGLSTNSAPNQQRLAQTPWLLPALVALLRSSDAQVQAGACLALRDIAAGPPGCSQRLLEVPGALPRLVALLDGGNNDDGSDDDGGSDAEDAAWYAASCIANIAASNPALREPLGAQPRLLEDLVTLIGQGSDINSVHSMWSAYALSKLADSCHVNQQRIAATPRALQGLVSLLGSTRGDKHKHAALALASIASGPPPCGQQVLGTPEVLTRLAALVLLGASSSSSSSWLHRIHIAAGAASADALGHLSRLSPAARVQVSQEPGVVGGLAALLSSSCSAEAQQHAATALASLAADSPDTSQQILSCPSVLTAISGLLSSSEESVRAAGESLAGHLLRHMASPAGGKGAPPPALGSLGGGPTSGTGPSAAGVGPPAGDQLVVAGLQALVSSGGGEVQQLAQQLLAGWGEGQGGAVVQ